MRRAAGGIALVALLGIFATVQVLIAGALIALILRALPRI